MAPSRTVLVGIPPVLTAMPPGRGCGSTRQTRLPKYAAWAAPFSPAGPAPITTRSYFAGMRDARLPGLASALAGDRPCPRSGRILEERAAHARRKRAHIDHGVPAVIRDLVLGALWYVQRLSRADRQSAIAHAHIALALEHVHDLFCGRVPVLGIHFPGQNVHHPEALLARRHQIVVRHPLDRSPFVDDRLDVLGLGDRAFQHGCLLVA